MKIGIVSQLFPPEEAAVPSTLADVLAERGHDVKVLTGFPNHPYGKVYDGYRQRWAHVENRGPVRVRRVPLYPSHDVNPLRRAATFFSFAMTSAAASRFLADRDAIYVYSTPMTAAAAAEAVRLTRGRPYVLHIQDLWPESVFDSGMADGPARHVVGPLIGLGLRYLYRNAAHLLTISPTMRELLLDRGVPADKVSVVYNWSAEENGTRVRPDSAMRHRLGRPDRTIAVFAGNVGQLNDVDTIVDAAALCRADTPIDVAVIGTGTAATSAMRRAGDLGADNVRFLDRLPASEMPSLFGTADYQLVTLKDTPLSRATIPSKLGTALAHACPIITTVPGDVAALCAEGGFGLACPPQDPQALAETFRRACSQDESARRQMGRASLDFYHRTMSQAHSIAKIESVLSRVAART
ncbi:glycosyltransferase family 4 protein [Saccharopolyspora shandongensis]|uniref:glycosyltransferase family 4 protein n=1 Tax=Saccharopolyspora shandongensis TaxID=418495 RepID=UPI0033FA489A